MFQIIKKVFTAPTAEEMALRELNEAKLKLLEMQTHREYSESMCKFHETQIKRLTAYLHTATENNNAAS